MIIIINININDNDYQYQIVTPVATKKCIVPFNFYVYVELYKNMSEDKKSILLSDVSVDGDIVEKDNIIIDAKINGDVKSGDITTHSKSNIKGNIKSKTVTLGGKLKGNVDADKIKIVKSADIDGVLNQKSLSIEEGAVLKIKTETFK